MGSGVEAAHDFLDLASLMDQLRSELPAQPQVGSPISGEVVARVSKLLRRAKLNPREWQQHAVFRRGRYTRNIVGYSPGQFVALLLCWERGQQSPIHDHAGAHCFVKMLSGQLREQRFAWNEMGGAEPEISSEADAFAAKPEESVAFMHDSLGLHRIINPSAEDVAISLHIYSPPFEECHVFPPTGGAPKTAPMVSINAPQGAKTGIALAPSLKDLCGLLELLYGGSGAAAKPDHFAVLDEVEQVELSAMDWAAYASPAHFSEFHCVQNIVHCSDDISVMVACWSPGQKVPPHYLGRGQSEWVKVIHGDLKYQEFANDLFMWDVETESAMPEGSASVLKDCCSRMHGFCNASDEKSAVSIHVFSPPLTQFTYRTEKGNERRDVPMLLGGPAAHDARGLMHTSGRWYLSFKGLVSLVDKELGRADKSDSAITSLFRKAVFHEEEWRSHLQRALPVQVNGHVPDGPRYAVLARTAGYELLLRFWGQHGGDHDTAMERAGSAEGGGRSWTLILEGELEERAYAAAQGGCCTNAPGSRTPGRLLRVNTLKEESISFLDGSDVVERCCDSQVPCVSLHLYVPPVEDV